MISEKDNHWMPEVYDGEMTPEVLKKKEAARANAEKIKIRMLEVLREKKSSDNTKTVAKLAEA